MRACGVKRKVAGTVVTLGSCNKAERRRRREKEKERRKEGRRETLCTKINNHRAK